MAETTSAPTPIIATVGELLQVLADVPANTRLGVNLALPGHEWVHPIIDVERTVDDTGQPVVVITAGEESLLSHAADLVPLTGPPAD